MKEQYVIGLDYGTDSVRCLIVDTANGEEVASAVHYYRRWAEGKYCDPSLNMFRQHPLDYIEGIETAVTTALAQSPSGTASKIKAISVDTTGSTPVAVDQSGMPLALSPGFEENPHAMFILWKDHTATKEATEINELSKRWATDYTKYEGGVYSSEWFWAKILHTLRIDKEVQASAFSWVEHCDWIPFLLTGQKDVMQMKRSRCAAGHKAMWHKEFGGLPSNEFLTQIDPLLSGLRDRLYNDTYTADEIAGTLSPEWAEKLGLKEDIVITVGAFDAHMGVLGGQIQPYYLCKVMGTSTCDMLVAPTDEVRDIVVQGICGQVDGSIIPGMLGMEAGQSAFGDVYAWFRDLIAWPIEKIVFPTDLINGKIKSQLLETVKDQIIPELSASAQEVEIGAFGIIALDWLNGRRTPDSNQHLKGMVAGLNLGSDAPKIFRALVEATCFGAKSIVERFNSEGVKIEGIIALGGVAKKSPFIMQTMADVLNMPVKIARSEQACALGAAMFAATAAGMFPNVSDAMQVMGAGYEREYTPIPVNVNKYQRLYDRYISWGSVVEQETIKEYQNLKSYISWASL